MFSSNSWYTSNLQSVKPAMVAERLDCSSPTGANWVQCPTGSLLDVADRRVFSLGDLQFPPPLHSGAAPSSPHFTLKRNKKLQTYEVCLRARRSLALSRGYRGNISANTHLRWAEVIELLDCSPPNNGEPGSIPGRVTPDIRMLGNVQDDAAGRWVFSGISRFPRSCIPALLNCHSFHPPHRISTCLGGEIRPRSRLHARVQLHALPREALVCCGWQPFPPTTPFIIRPARAGEQMSLPSRARIQKALTKSVALRRQRASPNNGQVTTADKLQCCQMAVYFPFSGKFQLSLARNEKKKKERSEVRQGWSGAGVQGRGKREILEKDPPTSGIVQRDSHMRRSGGGPRRESNPANNAEHTERKNHTVAERLVCSPPTMANRVQTRPGHRIFACRNHAGRCRWSAGFLRDLPFPLPFHLGAAPYSHQSPSSALKTPLLKAAQKSLLTLLRTNTRMASQECEPSEKPVNTKARTKELEKKTKERKTDVSENITRVKRTASNQESGSVLTCHEIQLVLKSFRKNRACLGTVIFREKFSRQDSVQSTVGSPRFFDWLKHVLVGVNCLRTNHKGAHASKMASLARNTRECRSPINTHGGNLLARIDSPANREPFAPRNNQPGTRSAIGSDACRADLINCDPIVKPCGFTTLRPPNRRGRGIRSSQRKKAKILSPSLARPHILAPSTTEGLRSSPSETKRVVWLPLTARSVSESGNLPRPPPSYGVNHCQHESNPMIGHQREPNGGANRSSQSSLAGTTVTEQLVCSPPTQAIRVKSPAGSLRIFVGIATNDHVGRRVFSGISHIPRSFIPELLHTHLNHPHRLSRPR
ncbi:hypothetical protein PR048_024497, partial [Dryococelus australis]